MVEINDTYRYTPPVPPDPRRVAVRAVNHTPEEAQALETVLTRRHAKRTAARQRSRVTQQEKSRQGRLEDPHPSSFSSSHELTANAQRLASIAFGPTPEEARELERVIARQRAERASHQGGHMQPADSWNSHSVRHPPSCSAPQPQLWPVILRPPRLSLQKCYEEVLKHFNRQPCYDDDDAWDSDYYGRPASPNYEAQAAHYEACQPEQSEMRAAIRSQQGRSDVDQIVLLLALHYQAIKDHIAQVRGLPRFMQIGKCLAKTPFPKNLVATHRVIGKGAMMGQPLEWGLRCRDPKRTMALLGPEGVSFATSGNPTRGKFYGFVGCPAV